MAGTENSVVRVRFFTWPNAILGKYEIFHLHWPEHLVGRVGGAKGAARRLLVLLLLLRLRVTSTPVVRTLHNLEPHSGKETDCDAILGRGFDRITKLEIHLVPETENLIASRSVEIPHGGYEEPFASFPRSPQVDQRVLYFGLLKGYKGVERLVDVFPQVRGAVQLRIVGSPVDPAVTRAVREAQQKDDRITSRLDFVSDGELVREITAAQLVVFPYTEMHSSGAVLVALSLARKVLVPDSSTGRALRREFGSSWVMTFRGPLSEPHIVEALKWARTGGHGQTPPLGDRAWSRVSAAHEAAYRSVLSA
ncbi:glycosyltransferase [Marisediminicola senii]|uniref:glycosyltransferase n=1 Tax=Marisediminicola senii TaxID=2711233 RepID=UPI0038B25CD1